VRCLALIRQSRLDQFSTDYYYYPLSTSSQLGIILFNNQTPHNFNKENHATSPLANNTLASKVQLSKHHELSSAFTHHTRIMSQKGVSSLLCTYCFKRFTLRTWLHKHIEKDHPEYWAELWASKKRQADSPPVKDQPTKYIHSSSRSFPWDSGSSYGADDDVGTQPANEPANGLVDATATIRTYPNAGLPCAYVPRHDEVTHANEDPYYPFTNEEEFNFAEMVIVDKFSAKSIDKMLKGSVGVKDEIKASLKSNYCLRQMLDRMEDGLGASSWQRSHLENVVWNAQHAKEPIKFWHRDIIECAKWLLKQPAYADHLSYAPQQWFEEDGRRTYGEMHTADWWWERQVGTLPSSQYSQRCVWVSDKRTEHPRRRRYRRTDDFLFRCNTPNKFFR